MIFSLWSGGFIGQHGFKGGGTVIEKEYGGGGFPGQTLLVGYTNALYTAPVNHS